VEYGTQQGPGSRSGTGRHPSETETKQAFKTTEFWIFIVILLGLFLAGIIADGGSDEAIDGFGAERVWFYAVLLSGFYMLSRGLAKSGSRAPYVEGQSSPGGSLGERAKAAAQVMRGEGESSSSSAPTQQHAADEPRY